LTWRIGCAIATIGVARTPRDEAVMQFTVPKGPVRAPGATASFLRNAFAGQGGIRDTIAPGGDE